MITLSTKPDQLKMLAETAAHAPDGYIPVTRDDLRVLVFDASAARKLHDLVNNPHTADFLRAVQLEAAHQRDRWGEAHDRGKSAENWFWLVGYLAGKCLRAAITGEKDKALHHTISSAAALANWYEAIKKDTTGSGIGNDRDIKPVELARFEDGSSPLETGEADAVTPPAAPSIIALQVLVPDQYSGR